jgi:hypothetical protein
LIHPGIQIKPVKSNALSSDADFNEIRTHLGVKAVPVHAQIEGRILQSDQSWCDRAWLLHAHAYRIGL